MTEKRLRLLILTPEFTGYGGGIITFYRRLATDLVRRGVDVRVVQGSGFYSGERNATLVDGVKVETLERSRVDRWQQQLGALTGAPILKRSLAAAWSLWEQALEGPEFDVVEATDFGHLAAPVLLQSTHPCLIQMHGSQGQLGRHDPMQGQELSSVISLALETELCANAHVIQCSSQTNARYWATQTGREDVSVVHPAWSDFSDLSESPPSNRMAVFGRVQRWKGPQVLCEALRRMGKDAPDVDWYGRDTAFLGTQQTTIGWLKADFPDVWDKRFHHREQISPERVRAIQQGALFNIIPSTWDVFNFTVIEAMSSGRPVICSNGAGASELIEDGISGFVYAAEDSSALARTLQRASSMSESDRREMAAQARHRLAVLLDPEAITTARLNAYAAAGARQVVPRLHKDWVRDLCSAGPIGTDHLCFLDNLPLKSIMTYAGQRTLGKVTGR